MSTNSPAGSAEPIYAYAARAAKQPLQPYQYTPALLGPHDVEVTISHCGVCHTDLHLIDDQWGMTTFPLVPANEIIG
ncbi:MAG: alcohol/geraniol dehydrogenase [Acidobacteriota bacterium]